MLISINWLRDFISADIPPQDIAHRLTMSGFEVNAIRQIGSEWNNVVVAELLQIEPHPQADKLALTTLRAGDKAYKVVCGAPNIKPGIKVPLALQGARLPGGIEIKPVRIRGISSEGMICSERELALGDDASGIMILADDLHHGTPLATSLGLADTILDIDITPNRADCLSILGIAREISAIFDVPLVLPDTTFEEQGAPIDERLNVSIIDSEACPRYAARLLTNLTIAPSPLWLRRRLEACGIRSINNVVDVTNYVLLEVGQPMHAFDCARLHNSSIVVKNASQGQSFVTLDETERMLDDATLMICDAHGPIAVAGIMGGMQSGISSTTTSVVLESAYFNPASIARTSRRLGLKTEAAQRFEKGVDIQGVVFALNRAAGLIVSLSNAMVASGLVDCYPLGPSHPQSIPLMLSKAQKISGLPLHTHEMSGLLRRLNFHIVEEAEEFIQVVPPTYRHDICEPIDLVEEIVRLKGYDQIPSSVPRAQLTAAQANAHHDLLERIRNIMMGMGFYEVINYSFIAHSHLGALGLPENDERLHPVRLLNPLSSSQAVLRTTILPSILINLKDNLNNKVNAARLFEIANVFQNRSAQTQPLETRRMAGLISGLRSEPQWSLPPEHVDFFDVKGAVETLFDALHIKASRYKPGSDEPFLHPNRSQTIYLADGLVGSFGEVHPDVCDRFDIDATAFVFDFDLSIIAKHFTDKPRFDQFSRYPAIFRDIALIVDESLAYDNIIETIRAFKNSLITDCHVFDCYRGKNIPSGKKSIALRVKFQSPQRTLTDDEVNRIHVKLLDAIARATGAELRQS